MTGSYDASFYFAGALIVFSAVICYPLKRIALHEKRQEIKQAVVNPLKS